MMQITLEKFDHFINGSWNYDKEKECHTGIWIHSDTMDVSGGIITRKEIDRLDLYENKEVITISGLTQDTFEYFIEKYGNKLRAVRFFKNKLVEDWSLLGTLQDVEVIYWFHNQRITKLWNMSDNIHLKGLCISDFAKLKILDGIEKAPALEWFSMRDAVWDKTEVKSYTCFANTNVKYLHFGGKNIIDGDVSFVKNMRKLKCFDFAPNLFETEKIAWIMANCPNVKGYALRTFLEDHMYNRESGEYNIPALCMAGKGKRCFKASDTAKKDKLQREFQKMMDEYRGKKYDEVFKMIG